MTYAADVHSTRDQAVPVVTHFAEAEQCMSLCTVLQKYRAGQKRIMQKALAALAQETTALLGAMQRDCRELCATDASSPNSPDMSTRGGSNTQAAAKDSSEMQRGAEQPRSIAALLVLPGSIPCNQGVFCSRDSSEGQALATERLSQGFSADSTAQLVMDLAAARCRRLQHRDSGDRQRPQLHALAL